MARKTLTRSSTDFVNTVVLILLLTGIAFSQSLAQNPFEEFTAQIHESNSVKEISRSVSNAADVFKVKKKTVGNRQELADLTYQFAIFRSHLFNVLNRKWTPAIVLGDERLKFFALYKKNAESLDSLLTESIEIYENELRVQNIQLATAKFELARKRKLSRFSQRDNAGWESWINAEREIQRLCSDSIALFEMLLGDDNDPALEVSRHLADSYMSSADFDLALKYYRKFTSGVEKLYGPKSVNLEPTLRQMAAIWKTVGRSDELEKVENLLSKISKTSNERAIEPQILTPRATSFEIDGIEVVRPKINYTGPIGIRRGGTAYEPAAGDFGTSIRSRPETPNPSFNIIFPGRSQSFGSKVVKILIMVDPEGKVISAEGDVPDMKMRSKAESEVLKWQFEPLILDGKKVLMHGVVYYYFKN